MWRWSPSSGGSQIRKQTDIEISRFLSHSVRKPGGAKVAEKLEVGPNHNTDPGTDREKASKGGQAAAESGKLNGEKTEG